MSLDEMQAWFEAKDGGEEPGTVITAFKLARMNPESAGYLAKFASVIPPTDESLFLIAFGHFIAVYAIDQLYALGVPWQKDPPAPQRVQ